MKKNEVDKTPSVSDCKNVAPGDVPGVLNHFVVRPMSSHETLDQVRAQLDKAMQDLALKIRQFPTLPADPQDPTHHLTKVRVQIVHCNCQMHTVLFMDVVGQVQVMKL